VLQCLRWLQRWCGCRHHCFARSRPHSPSTPSAVLLSFFWATSAREFVGSACGFVASAVVKGNKHCAWPLILSLSFLGRGAEYEQGHCWSVQVVRADVFVVGHDCEYVFGNAAWVKRGRRFETQSCCDSHSRRILLPRHTATVRKAHGLFPTVIA